VGLFGDLRELRLREKRVAHFAEGVESVLLAGGVDNPLLCHHVRDGFDVELDQVLKVLDLLEPQLIVDLALGILLEDDVFRE